MNAIRIVLVAAILAVSSGAAVATQPARMANACSCQDCDPVNDSPIIVGGWIRDWREAGFEHPGGNSVLPILLDFEPDALFKGWLPARVTLLDGASLDASSSPGQTRWAGVSGGCGAFDWDPQGQYIIAGTSPSSWVEGAYGLNRLSVLYVGDSPEGDAYDRAIARLSYYGQPRPPSTGNSFAPATSGIGQPYLFAGLALISYSAAMLARAFLRRREK